MQFGPLPVVWTPTDINKGKADSKSLEIYIFWDLLESHLPPYTHSQNQTAWKILKQVCFINILILLVCVF